jgi:hypothetical protein
MDFYHLSGAQLAVGSIIEPGNWGRIIRATQWTHNQAVREMVLEAARLARFATMPSRLDCNFGFISLDEANVFRSQIHGFGMHILYRVSLKNEHASNGVTEWRLSQPHGPLRPNWADDYWQMMTPINEAAATGGGREMLTLSQLIVQDCLK